MDEVMKQLVKFVTETKFNDLPENVIHETKRILLDCSGNAVSANESDRGKISVKLAKRLGGPPEATIIGTCDKVSCANAAFADGELIDAQDYGCVGCGIHSAPHLVPGPLVMAESTGASGKDLLLSLAITFELSARLSAALTPIYESIVRKDGKYELSHPPVCGGAFTILAAAAGTGKIMKLDQETLANAIGIAGYYAMPNTFRKWTLTTPVRMTKSDPAGWSATGAVTATLLADMGYAGDTDLFDGDCGFWRFSGSDRWHPENLLTGLGKDWVLRMNYKEYPAGWCRVGANRMLIEIMEENNLKPEDIDHIHTMTHPLSAFKMWRENKLKTQEDLAFNAGYLLACAAYGVRKVDYGDLAVRNDPKIREFMKKVDSHVDEDYVQKYAKLHAEDPLSTYMQIEVTAKGKTFFKSVNYQKGVDHPSSRMTDEELIEKFSENVERTLPTFKIDRAVKTIFGLDKIQNVAELMETITL